MALSKTKTGIAVQCSVCHLRKKPIGRSAPLEMANSLCDHDCPGYVDAPHAGSLWPGESEHTFGYLVGSAGTKEERLIPKMLLDADLHHVRTTVASCMANAMDSGYWDEDSDHYIVEALMEDLFGPGGKPFYDWKNALRG